ncbi:AAA family ATPase [Mucilaginibacter sp. OK098]|uniref:AAA family ATPase n=1 Tax=Mucilaginibacter sp. OK098 TaxID=1855297 RepID=UPI00091D4970|nr:AAA family ATPase [Mucilaginibacter sp. OK098]SHN02953.1 Homeodomain-like domain-containing protein [Mucilaginibacter sp. OK098]
MTKPTPPPFTPFVRPREIESIRNDTRASLVNDDEFMPVSAANEEEEEEEEDAYLDDDDNDEALPDDEYEYDPHGAFIIRTGEDWQHDDREIPESAMLFGEFWHQNELCILFADTNVGKSVLAVQIADSISRGQSIGHLQMDAPAVPVLYFDFELSDQQFRRRYSSPAEGKHPFTKNFCRATLNPFSDKQNRFKTYEEFINNEIENALLAYKAKVLIIDNITCLRYGTQSAAGAQNLMQYLQNIKLRYQISILVLAHTPKRNTTKPLSRNDLQGSKMLINFADSAFAIGESQQSPGLRYLKQIKQRNNAEVYGAANICTGAIAKPGNFLHFQFGSQGYETDHLTPYTEQYRKNTQTRIAQLNQQGQTIRQIAAHLGLAPTTVFRTLKRLEGCADEAGCADMQMRDEKINERPDVQVRKSAPGLILSLSKDDVRKGPDNVHVPTNQGCIMEDAERKGPEDPIPQPNAPTLTPPPSSDTSMHITGNNFGLYKQYQKELALLKADERANERRRKKAAKAEGT